MGDDRERGFEWVEGLVRKLALPIRGCHRLRRRLRVVWGRHFGGMLLKLGRSMMVMLLLSGENSRIAVLERMKTCVTGVAKMGYDDCAQWKVS